MHPIAKFIIRHARLISMLGAGIALIATVFTTLLYMNLRPDIEELLPTSSRSVKDLMEVRRRMNAIENFTVLLFSDDKVQARKFATDLAHELQTKPRSLIYRVDYQVNDTAKFFKRRQALHMDLEDLHRIYEYLLSRLQYERARMMNPKLPEPRLDTEGLREKYMARAAEFDRYPGGYFATSDEKVHAVVVYLPTEQSGIDGAIRVKKIIADAVERLKPAAYSPDLKVRYTGNIQNILEEHDSLIEDLTISTVIVAVLVTLAMLLFFRTFWATSALVVSLFMGTLWTFGLAYFLVGYLNANSAFLGSIVIGNGINFGIIYLARYLEARRSGQDHPKATSVAISTTSTSTLTAALAAGLSYGSLMLTGFRGFSQFGVIGLTGMILCWLSAYLLLPAFLTVLDEKGLIQVASKKSGETSISHFLAKLIENHFRIIWAVSLVILLLAIATFPQYKRGIVETDINKIRSRASMETGSGSLFHYIEDIFGRGLSPEVILAPNRDLAEKIASRLRQRQFEEGESTDIAHVQTMHDFVPTHQIEKIQVLHALNQLIPPQIMSRLQGKEKTMAEALMDPPNFQVFNEQDLPDMIKSKFLEKDGSVGSLVMVDKKFAHDVDDANKTIDFVKEIRDVTDSVAPGAPVAGQMAINADMFQAVKVDGPKTTLVAFIAVVLLVVLLFRRVKTVTLCLFALCLGVAWMAGLALGFHIKINFLNFIALPITFGIGIDYGVNIFQRYQVEGRGSIINVIAETGAAVALCSFTTVVGYSSLLIAGNRAFVSFGLLAVIGEICCATAAIVSLPAFLQVMEQRLER